MTIIPTSKSLHLLSPAKLNLHLEVLGRRPDGFHDLETLMTTVSLFDGITIAENAHQDGTIELNCEWAAGLSLGSTAVQSISSPRDSTNDLPKSAATLDSTNSHSIVLGELPAKEENLVFQAATLLRQHALSDNSLSSESIARIDRGLLINIVKRIPSAAGLGGASSNAATTLLALNNFWKLNWPISRLSPLAATIGSDVPFFLYAPSAICRGRGEIVEPIKSNRLDVVIVRPPASLATAQVFSSLKQSVYQPQSINPILECWQRREPFLIGPQLFNRLQRVAGTICDWIGRLQREFANLGCLGHQLTGSGSCYFGICRNRRHALNLFHRLRQRRLGIVYICHTG